jgi:hypothetical protein
MLCVRCSHPLSPRADRCLRCFALNPQNRPSDPVAQVPQGMDSEPVRALSLSIASDPPVGPSVMNVTSDPPALIEVLSISSEPPPEAGEWRLPRAEAALVAHTEPELPQFSEPEPFTFSIDPEPQPTQAFAKPRPAQLKLPMQSVAPPILTTPAPARVVEAPQARTSSFAGAQSRLKAWSIDAGLLALLFSMQVALAAIVTGRGHEWLDLLLSTDLRAHWLVLGAIDALAWSWLFGAIGQTPGMATQHQHLRTVAGRPPNAAQALQRAVLSLLSGAAALFGFTLALFDRRGQTLHDKLCGCVVTID